MEINKRDLLHQMICSPEHSIFYWSRAHLWGTYTLNKWETEQKKPEIRGQTEKPNKTSDKIAFCITLHYSLWFIVREWSAFFASTRARTRVCVCVYLRAGKHAHSSFDCFISFCLRSMNFLIMHRQRSQIWRETKATHGEYLDHESSVGRPQSTAIARIAPVLANANRSRTSSPNLNAIFPNWTNYNCNLSVSLAPLFCLLRPASHFHYSFWPRSIIVLVRQTNAPLCQWICLRCMTVQFSEQTQFFFSVRLIRPLMTLSFFCRHIWRCCCCCCGFCCCYRWHLWQCVPVVYRPKLCVRYRQF